MKTPDITFITVLFLVITTEVVVAFTQNHASILPTRTTSSQPQQSFHLQPRSDPTAVVNFDLLSSASATCAFSLCVYPTAGAASVLPSCTAVPSPCPSAVAAAGGNNCSTFPLDCYCQQPTPLYCAWSCSWYQWFLAEDWFKTQCPDIPPIDFNSAPKCARQCLWEQSISYGCVASTRNCFCSHGSLFDCEKQCKGTVAQSLVDWFKDQCLVSESEAEYDTGVSSSKSAVIASLFKSPYKLHWYEIVPITIASLSGAVFIGVIIMNGFL
jgi:hypothetical protein